MEPSAQQISTCPTCGAVLEETFGGGLGCMVCLLRAGIGSEDEPGHAISTDHGETEALESNARFGVYEIERHPDGNRYELGRGAMGVTYRAIDTTLQRKVALKIIKIDVSGRSADARERFMREAHAAAVLSPERGDRVPIRNLRGDGTIFLRDGLRLNRPAIHWSGSTEINRTTSPWR